MQVEVYCGDRLHTAVGGELAYTARRMSWLITLLLLQPLSAATTLGAQAAVAAERRTVPDSIRDFGALVARLSERGGYFNTDNLISNESSYLHVIGTLERLEVQGGVYIGVGPDQNFSYVARIRPRVAFMIDIRRDNMLQHLMFKALFAGARNRAEYLAYLLGRPVPSSSLQREGTPVQSMVASIDSNPPTDQSKRRARDIVLNGVKTFGVQLSAEDIATIDRFHAEFIEFGLSLQFTTKGRPPQYYYPTLRQLVLERDANGRMASYLARESDFQAVKSMQRRNLIVPVVGDLAGPHALRAIGQYAREHNQVVSAIYVSNAEDYLLRGGSFTNYAQSVGSLPRGAKTVMIRSFFGGPGSHAHSIGDYYSTQLVQRIEDFLAAVPAVRFYRDLVQQKHVPTR